MNWIDWSILALVVVGTIWMLVAQSRRINRENAEMVAERDRQLADAVAEALRNRKVYEMPFQNFAAKREWAKRSKSGK